MRVTKSTRASRSGKTITCPTCGASETVYHFSWSALPCASCGTVHAKRDWIVGGENATTEPVSPVAAPAPVMREARPVLTALDALEVLADPASTEAEVAAALALLR